ncbi:MAG: hypothetical protein ACQEQN_07390 [Thermodesulfobacteriota bacterium]
MGLDKGGRVFAEQDGWCCLGFDSLFGYLAGGNNGKITIRGVKRWAEIMPRRSI